MNRETVFTAFLILLVGAAVLQAREWPGRATLFPTIIGVPLLCMLLLHFVLSMRHGRRAGISQQGADGAVHVMDPAERRRVISILVWLVSFAVLVWTLGFPIGGTLGTFLYLVFTAREKLPVVFGMTLGTALFFYVTMVWLRVPYPRGPLLDLLGGL